jgi:hypothetical protein
VAAAATAAGGEDGEAISLDEARKLRREAQTLRKRLNDFEEREKAVQEAALTDTQKAQKRVVELEQAQAAAQKVHQERVIRYEVMLKASGLNVIEPDAAVKLMDWGGLEFAEDGTPKNVEAVLKKLIKEKPYLVRANSGLGTPAGREPRPPAPVTGQAVRRVTPL